jgi:hypothetical protein
MLKSCSYGVNVIYKYLLLCLLISLAACSTTAKIQIEVKKPAVVTLPVMAQNIIIINNTVSQPVEDAISMPLRKKDRIYEHVVDSASWMIVERTFKQLSSPELFKNVSYYIKWLREVIEWASIIPLSEDVKKELMEDKRFDVVISIDKLTFKTKKSRPLGLFKARVIGSIDFTVYAQGESKPLVVRNISDTLSYRGDYFLIYFPSSNYFRPMIIEMIEKISSSLGKKLGKHFQPEWEKEERLFFYDNRQDKNKFLNYYILKDKWPLAKSLWMITFENEAEPAKKAILAANIALAQEMTDDLDSALIWAKDAKELYEKNSAKNAKQIQYMENYISKLQKRIMDNQIIDEQYGIDY